MRIVAKHQTLLHFETHIFHQLSQLLAVTFPQRHITPQRTPDGDLQVDASGVRRSDDLLLKEFLR